MGSKTNDWLKKLNNHASNHKKGWQAELLQKSKIIAKIQFCH